MILIPSINFFDYFSSDAYGAGGADASTGGGYGTLWSCVEEYGDATGGFEVVAPTVGEYGAIFCCLFSDTWGPGYGGGAWSKYPERELQKILQISKYMPM